MKQTSTCKNKQVFLYLQKFALWMLLLPYFLQHLCPSCGIPFLTSIPGRRRWYTTSTTLSSSPAALAPSLQAQMAPTTPVNYVPAGREAVTTYPTRLKNSCTTPWANDPTILQITYMILLDFSSQQRFFWVRNFAKTRKTKKSPNFELFYQKISTFWLWF